MLVQEPLSRGEASALGNASVLKVLLQTQTRGTPDEAGCPGLGRYHRQA